MTVALVISGGQAALLIVVGVIALGAAAFLSATDTSLGRISSAYAADLLEDGRRGAGALVQAVDWRKRFRPTLISARALLQSLGFVSLAVAAVALVSPWRMPWWLVWMGTLVGIGAVQLALSLFSLTMLRGDRFVSVALLGAPAVVGLQKLWERIPGVTPVADSADEYQPRLQVADEIREIVDEVTEGHPESALAEEDRKILRSVFELGQTRIGEVMVPRSLMVTVDGDSTVEEAMETCVHSGFSRIPVIGQTLDDIQGVVYLKDLAKTALEVANSQGKPVRDLVRKAAFVPEMKLAGAELREMQSSNTHLALVVDEYGGIAGLVTIEDILEELVGEMVDEHDKSVSAPVEQKPGLWLVPSSFSVDDLAEILNIKIGQDEVYSVGGLLTKALHELPSPGDTAVVEGLRLTAGQNVGRRGRVLDVLVSVVDEKDE